MIKNAFIQLEADRVTIRFDDRTRNATADEIAELYATMVDKAPKAGSEECIDWQEMMEEFLSNPAVMSALEQHSYEPDLIRWEQGPSAREKAKIYSPPGWKLHALAKNVLTGKTFEHVFEPILSDMQREHQAALAARQYALARWRRVQYTVKFWTVLGSMLPISAVRRLVDLWKLSGT